MPDELTYEFFSSRLGTVFRLDVGAGHAIELRLGEVTRLPPLRRLSTTGEKVRVPDALRAEPFSMVFRGPLDVRLPQATYRMTHESAAEPLDIFVVPVSRDADGLTYQAIFS